MPGPSASPFFKPTEKPDFTQTPGGSRHRLKKPKEEEEHKSTVVGASANLINAIVGSGIVGLPFAIQQAGFVAGITLVITVAILTEKSLRLLVETAKHVHVPSYETAAEAAFGRFGFMFIVVNMFIMAYGAMLSYLMIVKDTFSSILGVDPDNEPMKRAILFIISVAIMLPLSSQRDMADLAKTSRLNVTFDILMVCIVLYVAPIRESWETFDISESIIHPETIFVGLGVLSFAFVCQHSSFIIAGSLENPTQERWSTATRTALSFCSFLALACGVGGFIGFHGHTQGNILNSLPGDSTLANVARGLLGTTMLFVYPMESFVARHVCVVLFFQGRKAHEGDDTSVLNRRDRRITLTVVLYLSAVIPAALCTNLGTVLAICGAIGGSSLAYIGPGAVYLGIHGARFLELSKTFFGEPHQPIPVVEDEEAAPLYNAHVSGDLPPVEDDGNVVVTCVKKVLWYILLMPVWSAFATVGKETLTRHVTDLALKSPHPIRIGNVRFATANVAGEGRRVVMLKKSGSTGEEQRKNAPTDTMLLRADSLGKDLTNSARMTSGKIVALPPSSSTPELPKGTSTKDYKSINQRIGAMARRQKQEEELALEDDPQQVPPGILDFAIAILYVIFGVVALAAGILSIFLES